MPVPLLAGAGTVSRVAAGTLAGEGAACAGDGTCCAGGREGRRRERRQGRRRGGGLPAGHLVDVVHIVRPTCRTFTTALPPWRKEEGCARLAGSRRMRQRGRRGGGVHCGIAAGIQRRQARRCIGRELSLGRERVGGRRRGG
eukprot:scaffold7202_cov110-Isochrysis_galbana.AAC.6